MSDLADCVELLRRWVAHSERYWYRPPDRPALGCYGTGYNSWGVQTNQKYLGALAVLATLGPGTGPVPAAERDRARARALAALRFSLASHLSGDYRCTDGTRWGHTWISALGIERMMHGVALLLPHCTDDDQRALRRVLTSEADWVFRQHRRGGHVGVFADPWSASGKNVPESNLWNGAILWRAAVMYPDHPQAGDWRERAHQFLVNAVSVAADAADGRVLAGRPVAARHVGANFFPHYALDHHGYLNVGYMVICLSNAAMLHFDLQALGLPVPDTLYHHLGDLWDVTRRMVFADGRLARIGGDSRVRYAYSQEFLLPTLLFAADALGERHAATVIDGQVDLIRHEAAVNGDGSFFGQRLAPLAATNPYYFTRLESDRACALGMLVCYARQRPGLLGAPATPAPEARAAARGAFERSVAGAWCEPAHGAALHRCPTRLASFAWRAHGLTQGLCQPPHDGHLAEWSHNLAGRVRFLGDDGVIEGGQDKHRRLLAHWIAPFDGGFATCGAVLEGVELTLPEGWRGGESAVHHLAFVALPDGHTVVGVQLCRTLGYRTYVAEVKGLRLNVPNDLFNAFRRRLATEAGSVVLESPPARDEVVELGSSWVALEDQIGAVGLYGAPQLAVHRSPRRRGGRYASLYADEVCFHCELEARAVDPHSVILDVGWAALSGVGREHVRHVARTSARLVAEGLHPDLRGVRVPGVDGRWYLVVANFGQQARAFALAAALDEHVATGDLLRGDTVWPGRDGLLTIEPGRVGVVQVR